MKEVPLILPKRMVNAYKERQAAEDYLKSNMPTSGCGWDFVTVDEGMELMDNSKFRDCLDRMQRAEGHEKMVGMLARKQLEKRSLDEKVLSHNYELSKKVIKMKEEDLANEKA